MGEAVLTASRLIGFEALGNTDEFDTLVLEMRLLASGKLSKLLTMTR